MGNVKFRPWVGAEYHKGINGKKVLVLGESHYCAHYYEAVPDITINVIEELFNPNSEHEGYKNTYTKFINALSGESLHFYDFEKLKLWWNRVMFYNYVQRHMSAPRKEKPTQEDFASAQTAFFEVLEQYRPDCVIVWGIRNYDNLPQSGEQGEGVILKGVGEKETWEYQLTDGHRVRILRMNHPSTGYTPEYWHKFITALLENK